MLFAGLLFLAGVCPGAGILKENNPANLNLGSSWVGGLPPGAGDVAQWTSTVSGPNSVSLGANLNWQGMEVINPGGPVSITAGGTLTLGVAGLILSNATQNLTVDCALELSANQSWPVAGGRSLTVTGGTTGNRLITLPGPGSVVVAGGTYTFGTAAAGNNALALNGGTLRVESGTLQLNSNGNSNDGSHIQGGAVFEQSGGTVNSSYYTRLGAGGAGTLSLGGGVFNNTGEILFGFGGSGNGTLTLSGTAELNAHFLRLGQTGLGTVNLDGGTLRADRIFSNKPGGIVNFNGGVLEVNASPTADWFADTDVTAYVKSGGAIINTRGKNVALANPLLAAAGSTGGLVKLGEGTLTLTGNSTYVGPTVVSNGTLAVSGSLSPASAVTVADDATFAPGPGTISIGSLTLASNATLRLALGAPGNPSNAALQVNGNLVLDGTVAIEDLGGVTTGAVYSVIHYTGSLADKGLAEDVLSAWELTVDASTPQQVKLTAVRKHDFIEIQEGDLVVTSLYTNLTATLHGTSTDILWYEVRSNVLDGVLLDFGAHASSSPWPFTVRHLREGTNWVTAFAQDTGGTLHSNSVRLVLNLPPDTPVRPRPIPAEIWWGGLSTNQQLLDPTKPWDFVKLYQDGLFFHSAGYGGLTSSDKTDLATMLRPYNTKFWAELGGGVGTQTPGPGFINFQANTGWGAHLTAQQDLGLVMSQVTHDYHMEDMEDVCRVHPGWPAQDQVAWWTGDLTQAGPSYPEPSGIWRDIFQIYYTNNPHLKVGHTSSPVWWPWDAYPALVANHLRYNPLKDTNGVPILVNGTNVNFSFTAHEIVEGFVNMAAAIDRPYFSWQTDNPWEYMGKPNGVNPAGQPLQREKIRTYEQWLHAHGARHTLICNASSAASQPGGDDAQDLYYKNGSLGSLFLHQQEGGRANVYLFESWYAGIPHAAAPETKEASYANLAMAAIQYLKGIKTNGTLQTLSLTLSGTGVTNLIQLTNNGDLTCLPAVIALEGAGGSNAITYLNAANQDITAAMLSGEGYIHTNRLNPGQGTQIKVVAPAGLDRTVTLEAFWNPQDPSGVVRDRLVLTPPNQPPILAPLTNQTMIAGQTLVITNVATDPDVPPQTLTFSLVSAPTNAVIDPGSGLFTWTPLIAQSPLITQLRVKVADDGVPSFSDTQAFWVTVNTPAQPALSSAGLSNGAFNLLVNGDVGPDYTVQAATNLTSPVIWSTLVTTNPAMLPFPFTDPAASNFNQRFYRVRLGP